MNKQETTLESTAVAHQLHLTADTIDRIAEMAHASICHQEVKGTTHIIVPGNHKHIDITQLIENAQPNPSRKKNVVTVHDIASFLILVEEQKSQETGYIYANANELSITAVFNDNRSNAAGWRDHKAQFKAELSREFLSWNNKNKQTLSQEEFATFLEDNIADVVEPSADTLLKVALSLDAKTNTAFNSAKRLDNGQVQFSYTETIDARAAGGTIEVPREFSLGLRIFKNGEAYKIKARLKYRLNSGSLKFWYELDRIDNIVETAFQDYVSRLETSGYTVLLGSAN